MIPLRSALSLAALSCVALSFTAFAAPAIPAFPGAEGAGAFTPGGRGGRVIKVSNLNDSGPGSFRAAVEAEGPRIVVFAVGGLITLESPVVIKHPYLTIAGQTAPGDGICIRGDTTTIDAGDVIIRHLRFRRGNLKSRDDALNAVHSPGNIIIDHCSFSWGLDENVSIYRYMKREADGKRSKNPIENLTIQWCISSEALDLNHHAFGATWGGRIASFHHNLFASNTARNPSIGWGDQIDFRNNVIFNWQHRTVDGGDSTSVLNIVNNYYKPGPATQPGPVQHRIAKPEAFRTFNERPEPGRWHVTGNVVEGHPKVSADNWAGGVQYGAPAGVNEEALHEAGRKAAPVPMPAVAMTSAEEAYAHVLNGAGATKPRRDSVDERVIASVRSGKPTFAKGIIRTPEDVGGWPEYRAGTAPPDQDDDGMPDLWETARGLNPRDAKDSISDKDANGYTAIEDYINSL